MERKGLLLVFSGPCGTGKGTVCKALVEGNLDLRLSISATTRSPRTGEVEGVNYIFLKKEDFKRMIAEGHFLEWAKVYGNYYGTPLPFIQKALEKGNDMMLEIDIQGAFQVREKIPEAVLIFVAPPSMADLKLRLNARGADSPEEIQKRLCCAIEEMKLACEYDYVIINDEVARAVEQAQAIIKAEKCRARYLKTYLAKLISM